MRRSTFLLLCAACVVVTAPAAFGQAVVNQQVVVGPGGEGAPLQILPPGRQAKTGTSRMRGRIIASDTGAPVRRAQVRISSPDIGTKSALTDPQGRYEFRDLPAGRFNLSVSKSGYVTMQYGQNRPFEPGRPIELADGQAMDKADLSLPRGGVVAGHVVDEFGEPVSDAMVSAMRMQYAGGRRRLVPAGRQGQTNDLGQFRIYGLPPGDYYISANLRSIDSMIGDLLGSQGGPSGSNQNSGYAPTYYPGTPNPAEAQRVTVAVGQELASIDIGLQPVRLAKITGTAIGSDGKPVGGAMVMLMPSGRDAMMFMPGGTSRTAANGQFTLNGVAPGDYSLQVRSVGAMMSEMAAGAAMVFSVNTDGPGGGAPRPAQEPEFASVGVTVSGDDLSNLVVVTTRGSKAAGKVIFDTGTKPDGINSMRIMAPSTDLDNPAVGVGGAGVKADGTFELSGLSGTRLLRALNPPKGFITKSVRLNGADVTDAGIEFKPGEDVAGIEIEMTSRTTTVTGTVTDDHGQPLKDYTVVVFSTDRQKWTLPNTRWTSSARPDQEGHFKVSNLPAGTYSAIAVEYVAAGEWNDPDWLDRASQKGKQFTLDEAGSKSIELKLSAM